ncbi:hypothetical protein HYFRA_00003688 [Hymenoscyphus fraxineus]|uniref:Cytochrome P450 n=1 Tax=Hymenoscyphus fraxineus TaxID=746836 RepID=A0A9N9L182_9HELO|nr:hypothetical protein HYFRA_00003688 [Hymenoscyphus fraxineus]
MAQSVKIPSFRTSFLTVATLFAALVIYRIIYNLYFHPLAKFPGPWWAAVSTLPDAIIAARRKEVTWFQSLIKKYGADTPIRVQPNLLLFVRPSALKPIYRDPDTNTKSKIYMSKFLGPTQVFCIRDGNRHRAVRKAVSGGFTIGAIQKTWESKIDGLINLWLQKITAKAKRGEELNMSDRTAQFSADVMTLVSFGQTWGFIENERDERGLITSFRKILDTLAAFCRSSFIRETLAYTPIIMNYLVPDNKETKEGWGFLFGLAIKEVAKREEQLKHGIFPESKDFMQYAMEATLDGRPLTLYEKQAQVTLLILAGADTTAVTLACLLRFLVLHPQKLQKARQEIDNALENGLISAPVKFQEALNHLPYFIACAKEALRLNPPAAFIFSRVTPPAGKTIDGHLIPGGTDVVTQAHIVQRDPILYAPDPEVYRPERWLESDEKTNEFEAASFVFGTGPRVCLGKDIALMELYKLVPEVIRNFDIELINEGTYHISGQVTHLDDFIVKLHPRVS